MFIAFHEDVRARKLFLETPASRGSTKTRHPVFLSCYTHTHTHREIKVSWSSLSVTVKHTLQWSCIQTETHESWSRLQIGSNSENGVQGTSESFWGLQDTRLALKPDAQPQRLHPIRAHMLKDHWLRELSIKSWRAQEWFIIPLNVYSTHNLLFESLKIK